jgi:hypothetical protein
MKKIISTLAIMALCACGSSDSTSANPAKEQNMTDIQISGSAVSHPINEWGKAFSKNEIDFSSVNISVADPLQVLFSPDAEPLAGPKEGKSCAREACAFDFAAVDIHKVEMGLLIMVTDTRTGNLRKWMKTATGVASRATVLELKKSLKPLAETKAYAISLDAEAAICAAMGVPAGTYEKTGFVVATLVDKDQNPVAGATVQVTPDKDSHGNILPAKTLVRYVHDHSLTETATDASGIFIVVPAANVKSLPQTAFNVTKEGMKWNTGTLGIAAEHVLTFDYYALAPTIPAAP